MQEKTKIGLVIAVLLAFVSLGATSQHFWTGRQNVEVAFEEAPEYIALDHYVASLGVHRQEAWWEWQEVDRHSPISILEMWRYHDIFNKYLPEKCERYEDWGDYYRKVVVPCLWYDVAFQHAPSKPEVAANSQSAEIPSP